MTVKVLRASVLAMLASLLAAPAQASFLAGEALDTMANVLAWVVLCVVPALAISLFWIVHVMPEKIAEKRHHPQKEAIHTLCLLSLVFGGLLWPFAWLWAYTRPVVYKMAHGTEKHEDFYVERGEQAEQGALRQEHIEHLLQELDQLEKAGPLTPELRRVRERALAARLQASVNAGGPVATEPGGA